jgi:hypothetical protein
VAQEKDHEDSAEDGQHKLQADYIDIFVRISRGVIVVALLSSGAAQRFHK